MSNKEKNEDIQDIVRMYLPAGLVLFTIGGLQIFDIYPLIEKLVEASYKLYMGTAHVFAIVLFSVGTITIIGSIIALIKIYSKK